MPEELISIIIPVYNVENYLDRCIKSVLSQTYSEIEIILVDDGSTDSSGEICDQYAGISTRVKVIHKENGGLSSARNTGMTVAAGNIISFIDSDDWIHSRFLEILYEELISNHAEIAGCRYIKTSEDNLLDNTITVQNQKDFSRRIYSRDQAMSSLIRDSIKQVVWNKIYRKEIIADIAFEEGKCHEDVFWSYQAFARINIYTEITYKGYYYFQRNNSIMGEGYSLKRLDAVEAKCRRQKFLETTMPQHSRTARIDLWYTCIYHGQQVLKNLEGDEKKKAMDFLSKVIEEYPLKKADYRSMSLKRKFWLIMAEKQFLRTCLIRNIIKTGI